MPPTPVEIVGGKVRHIDTGRDYKPTEPYRRDMATQKRLETDKQNEDLRNALRETIKRETEPFDSEIMAKRLGLSENGGLHRVGIQLARLEKEGACECISENLGAGRHKRYRTVPDAPPRPPKTSVKQADVAYREKIIRGMRELGGVDISPLDLLKQIGKEVTPAEKQRCGQTLQHMYKDGLVLRGERIPGMKIRHWTLIKEPEPVNDTEFTAEVALADLKNRMRRPKLPEHHERIIAELRGVARQFQEIGASEMLIRDLRVTADWLEGLRDA